MFQQRKFTPTQQQLLDEMAVIEVIDCHEHLPPESVRLETPQDVFTLFTHYTRLPLAASGISPEEKASLHDPKISLERRWTTLRPHLRNARFTSYFRAAFITAKEVYGFDDINDETYQPLSEAIAAANRPGIYKKIFDQCRIRAALTQCQRPALDPPLYPLMLAMHLSNPVDKATVQKRDDRLGLPCGNLGEYIRLCRAQLEQWISDGIVGIKIHCKMNTPPDEKAAEEEFKRLMGGTKVTLDQRLYNPLDNYVKFQLIEMAAELDLVVAAHSGVWDDFRHLDPRHMLTMAPAHPTAKFDLYHLGMPDIRAAIMVGAMNPNVWLNLCWSHILSQEQTCSGINELLDMVPINKVLAFGGDYKNPVEKIVGHLRMAKEDVAMVLGDRIDRGVISLDDAREIITLWFWENPLKLYTRVKLNGQ